MADNEYDNIRRQSLNCFVSAKDEKKIRGFFHRQQTSLINSLNRVNHYKVQHPDSPLTELYDHVIEILQNLLDDIRYSYPEYFNSEEKMPDHVRQYDVCEWLRSEIKLLEQKVAAMEKAVTAGRRKEEVGKIKTPFTVIEIAV